MSILKLQNAGNLPIQVSTTYVRKPSVNAMFKTVRKKPSRKEKVSEELAREILQQQTYNGAASGRDNSDLPLQTENPELLLIPAAAEIKTAGLIPGLLRTASGTIAGEEIGKVSANLGQKVDNVLSTRLYAPAFGIAGGLGGYMLGSNAMGGITRAFRIPRKTVSGLCTRRSNVYTFCARSEYVFW